MCGIIGALSFDGSPINQKITKQFKAQRSRGQEGFGLYDIARDNLVRSASGKQVFKYLAKVNTDMAVFHHRYPTSVSNIRRACHPISTGNFFKTSYLLVHNGYISNANELRAEHEKLGISYSTDYDGKFNDSEALLWDMALTLEGKQKQPKAQGAIAFICYSLTQGKKHNHLYFGRNTNPLNLDLTAKGLMLSSEGKGEAIEANQLYDFNLNNGNLKQKPMELASYAYKAPVTTYTDDEYYGRWIATDKGQVFEESWNSADEIADSLLLEPQLGNLAKLADVERVISEYSGVATYEGDAAYMLCDDLDVLWEYENRVTSSWKKRKLAYTIAVFEEALDKLYQEEDIKLSELEGVEYA